MLSDFAVKQFAKIYKDEFGVILVEKESRAKAHNTFYFFKTIIDELSSYEKVNNLAKKGGVLNDNKDKSN